MALTTESALRKDLRSGEGFSQRGNSITFQHRHYALLADIIKNMDMGGMYNPEYANGPSIARNALAESFADSLRHTNPNFNRARFLAACKA